MRSIRLFALVLAAFAAGIAFVLACGDDMTSPDAGGRADAADCSECEPAITPGRIYHVTDTSTMVIDQAVEPNKLLWSSASCAQTGGILLGGGCWVHTVAADEPLKDNINARMPLILSGPLPESFDPGATSKDIYTCVYGNPEGLEGFTVVATAICFMPAAAQ